jgi:hypothetical protein
MLSEPLQLKCEGCKLPSPYSPGREATSKQLCVRIAGYAIRLLDVVLYSIFMKISRARYTNAR